MRNTDAQRDCTITGGYGYNQTTLNEEFVDDLAATSMARLWDVGKTEPIKVGKASPTEGTMPTSIYIILKYMYL